MAEDVPGHDHSYLLHIRSKDTLQRSTGFNTDFDVELTREISRIPGHRLHVSISSAEIPFVFNNITSHLQSNQIFVNGAASLLLADGNYSVYDLVDAMTSTWNVSSTPAADFAMTYDRLANKVTIQNRTGVQQVLNFSTSSESKKLAQMLGFNTDSDRTLTAYTTHDGVNTDSTTSDTVVNLRPIHALYLHSEDLASTNVFTTQDNSSENIIGKIPIGQYHPLSVINYSPTEDAPFSTMINSDGIRFFNLSLRDQNGVLVQMNDVNYEISLFIQQFPQMEEVRSMIQPSREEPPPPPPPPSEPIQSIEPVLSRPNASSVFPTGITTETEPVRVPVVKRQRQEEEETQDKIMDLEHLEKQEQDLQKAIILAHTLPTF
ncbi:MAG: hypothetical protein CL512_06135 [Actinobacteria bacterium]|nr:hypothetical protein [Actinomycetota bacterium]|tara:strand:- start:2908 stop:4035 length:1128 start_codon:yes stop_codon:yes gene_type:complete